MNLENLKIHPVFYPMVFLALSWTFIGCTSDRTSTENESLKASQYDYPHPPRFRALHVKVISSQNSNDRRERCLTCHSSRPTAISLGRSISCGGSCHVSARNSSVLYNTLSSVVSVTSECSACHQQTKHSVAHYPTVAGLCTTCHKAEASHLNGSDKKAVSILSPEDSCFRCHTTRDQLPSFHSTPKIQAVACSSCHASHGGSFDKLLKEDYPNHDDFRVGHIQIIASQTNSDLRSKCITCHSLLPTPPSLGTSISCAEGCHPKSTSPEISAGYPMTKVANACSNCHQEPTHSISHYPVAAGLCSTCHKAEAEHLNGSSKKAVTTLAAKDSCYLCHARNDLQAVVHEAIRGEGGCSSCHSTHGGELKKLLKTEVPKLCVDCHKDSYAKGAFIHSGMKSAASCLNCHDPHSAPSHPLSKTPAPQLCFSCHKNSLIEGQIIHGAINSGKNCFNCHQSHTADNKNLLLVKSEQSLCVSCHNREIEDNLGRKLPNMTKLLKDSAFHHAPIDSEGCTDTCHNPHASQFSNLLTDAYPSSRYLHYEEKPNSFAVCFKCHDTSILNANISATDTQFRNDVIESGLVIRKNLHRFHIVDENGSGSPKVFGAGRSCSVCHDPHAAPQPHNIRSSWNLGRYIVKITYTATKEGGQCAQACHGPKSYQRLP